MSARLAIDSPARRSARGMLARLLAWLHEDGGGSYPPCPTDAPGLPFADARHTPARTRPPGR